MFQITKEDLEKLVNGFNLLNQLEIKGFQNVNILANSVAIVQEVMKNIKEVDEISLEKNEENVPKGE